MRESGLPPMNDAERLVAVARRKTGEEWRQVFQALSAAQVIDWLNALEEINGPVFREHFWQRVREMKGHP